MDEHVLALLMHELELEGLGDPARVPQALWGVAIEFLLTCIITRSFDIELDRLRSNLCHPLRMLVRMCELLASLTREQVVAPAHLWATAMDRLEVPLCWSWAVAFTNPRARFLLYRHRVIPTHDHTVERRAFRRFSQLARLTDPGSFWADPELGRHVVRAFYRVDTPSPQTLRAAAECRFVDLQEMVFPLARLFNQLFRNDELVTQEQLKLLRQLIAVCKIGSLMPDTLQTVVALLTDGIGDELTSVNAPWRTEVDSFSFDVQLLQR